MLNDLVSPEERLAPHTPLEQAKRYLNRKRISAVNCRHHFVYTKSEHGSRLLTAHRLAGIRAS